jgi:chemotaxis protein CheD
MSNKPIISAVLSPTKQAFCLSSVGAVQISAAVDLEEIRVDMAELKAETKPAELVACVGSCIALSLYDSTTKSGGMAHIMLPQAHIFPKEDLPAKFADTAVPALIKAIKKFSPNATLSAKIAGGANMFPNIRSQSMAVGAKNIEAVKVALATCNIPLKSEDVGGIQGRKVMFNTMNGTVIVRLLNGVVKKI